MGDKVIPKIVKSNLRGVLLSKVNGVPISDVLKEYRMVTQENMDFQTMGFSHLIEFLKAIPDVARIVNTPQNTMVVGVALNELNITARKSCFNSSHKDIFENHLPLYRNTLPNGVACNGEVRNGEVCNGAVRKIVTNNQHRTSRQKHKFNGRYGSAKNIKSDSSVSGDFRSSFLLGHSSDFGILKIEGNPPKKEDAIKREDIHENGNAPWREAPPIKRDCPDTLSMIGRGPRDCRAVLNLFGSPEREDNSRLSVNNSVGYRNTGVSMGDHHKTTKANNFSALKPAEKDSKKWSLLPELGEIPRSMTFNVLQRMYCDISPGSGRPLRSSYPSVVDIMLTHVERDPNYFWGIIIQPFDPSCDEVLNLGSSEGAFSKYGGEKRAIVKHDGYYCRVWVKSIEGAFASVFMIDFGNTEIVSVMNLKSSSSVWAFKPLAVPFRYVGNEKIDLAKNMNERHRCHLTDSGATIFDVEKVCLM